MNKEVYAKLQETLNSMWVSLQTTNEMPKYVCNGKKQQFFFTQNPHIPSCVDIFALTQTHKIFVGSVNLIQGSYQAARLVYPMLLETYTAGLENRICPEQGITSKTL